MNKRGAILSALLIIASAVAIWAQVNEHDISQLMSLATAAWCYVGLEKLAFAK